MQAKKSNNFEHVTQYVLKGRISVVLNYYSMKVYKGTHHNPCIFLPQDQMAIRFNTLADLLVSDE
jgi:hypothetical protein